MSLSDDSEPFSPILSNPGLVGLLLFGSFAAALLCYIWAFVSQSHKLPAFGNFLALSCLRRTSELRGEQNLYHAAYMLLLLDGATVSLGLAWGVLLFRGQVGVTYLVLFNLWYGFRFLSQCLHIIMAFVAVVFCQSRCGDALLIASKVLVVVPVILVVLSFRINNHILIGLDIYNFLLVLWIPVSCCQATSPAMSKQRRPIVLLSLSFYLFACVPNMVLRCLLVYSDQYIVPAVTVLLITNFYVILSALLFRLVLKVEDDQGNNSRMFERTSANEVL